MSFSKAIEDFRAAGKKADSEAIKKIAYGLEHLAQASEAKLDAIETDLFNKK
jgi:hypothetical protein